MDAVRDEAALPEVLQTQRQRWVGQHQKTGSRTTFFWFMTSCRDVFVIAGVAGHRLSSQGQKRALYSES